MAAQSAPLDEIVANRPDVIQWWMSGDHEFVDPKFMDERFIHRYFSETPYFDWSTKNGIAFSHAQTDIHSHRRVHVREELEDSLRRQKGEEYMIAGEPQQSPGKPKGETNGMWLVRKQDRSGQKNAKGEFQRTETLGTYFFVGPNVYQAPSVADVLENRMLNATTSLSKFYETAKRLPTFSPTHGYTYQVEAKKPTAATGSAAGSPSRSREGSVAPGADTQSLRSGSVAPVGQTSGTSNSADDGALLWQSLNMALSYSDEYMDENPITGEPGNFKFVTTTAAVRKRKADEEAAAKKVREQKESASRAMSAAPPTPKVEKPPSPPAVFTEAKSGGKSDKERKEERKRRRKSRQTATSPTTPTGATNTAPQQAGG